MRVEARVEVRVEVRAEVCVDVCVEVRIGQRLQDTQWEVQAVWGKVQHRPWCRGGDTPIAATS